MVVAVTQNYVFGSLKNRRCNMLLLYLKGLRTLLYSSLTLTRLSASFS